MSKRKAYSLEFRTEAAREVVEKSRPMATVARELGIVPQTLGNWVRKGEVNESVRFSHQNDGLARRGPV